MQINNPDFPKKLQESVVKGTEWVVQYQKEDGELDDCGKELVAYYKMVQMAALTGQIQSGIHCLQYIKRNMVNANGELCSGDGTIKTYFSHFQPNYANYMDGWIAIGSWLLGDYAFANSICENLIKQRCPKHGGIPTGPEKWSGRLRYDVLTNASAGRAFLLCGKHDEALHIADFLIEVTCYKHQRDRATGLDMSFDANWNHVEPPSESDRVHYRLDMTQKGERIFCPAFASAFLCEVRHISGKREHLDAAKAYFDVIAGTIEFKEGSLSNGKSGWAAGMLGLAIGDKRYREAAAQIVPKVLARQREDGEFGSSGTGQESLLPKRLETTAEHVTWVAHYLRMNSLGLWSY